jgi:tetratricopeptide (TPR) repeat protein
LAEVLHAAASTHHLMDFFPESEKYTTWTSSEAQKLSAALSLEHGLAAQVDAAVGAFSPSKPAQAFSGDHKELLSILDGKEPIIPALLRAKATRRDTSDIDGVFSKLDKSIPKMSKVELVRNLSEQMMFRAMVGQAVALEETNSIPEAIHILSKVVDGNRYLYMWRALEARGRCYRKFGKMDEAEADFKALFALKKNANRDIPSVDSYRTKSDF